MPNPRKYRSAIGDRGLTFRYLDIDLSVARDNEPLNIAGSSMFAPFEAFDSETVVSSALSIGRCFIRFGKSSAPAVYFTGNYSYRDPSGFDEIYVTNSAQANKMIRLYYSDGVDIIPFSAESAVTVLNADEIGGSTTLVTPQFGHGAAGAYATALLTPAANVNGAIVNQATAAGFAASDAVGVVAALAAPTFIGAGMSHGLTSSWANEVFVLCASLGIGAETMPYPVKLPAAYGIYACKDNAGTGRNFASWELL